MRRKPVAFFLGDAGFLGDDKFRDLLMLLRDWDDFNSAVRPHAGEADTASATSARRK